MTRQFLFIALLLGGAMVQGQAQKYNPLQVAQLRWYTFNENGTPVVVGPSSSSTYSVAFDGQSIWVVNLKVPSDSTVSKVQASDGTLLGTFGLGYGCLGIASDGMNMWIPCQDGLHKLQASNGTQLGVYAGPLTVAFGGQNIVYDGRNIWTLNGNSAIKVQTSTGSLQGTFPVGTLPTGVAFDGKNIWVCNSGDGTVTELSASNGFNLGTFPAGPSQPQSILFDGQHLWVVNFQGTVTEIEPGTGATLTTLNVGQRPLGAVFDGTHVWVTNVNYVTRINAGTAKIVGKFGVSGYPASGAFDGGNLWFPDMYESVSKY